jgi:hypothetical protein
MNKRIIALSHADHLRSPRGKTVGPTSTHCIRNACESSAIVCHH